MTPQELIDVAIIKKELDALNKLVVKATNGTYSYLIDGEALGEFQTEKDDFETALIVSVTALRDAKQIEFDDFVGTDV